MNLRAQGFALGLNKQQNIQEKNSVCCLDLHWENKERWMKVSPPSSCSTLRASSQWLFTALNGFLSLHWEYSVMQAQPGCILSPTPMHTAEELMVKTDLTSKSEQTTFNSWSRCFQTACASFLYTWRQRPATELVLTRKPLSESFAGSLTPAIEADL